MKKKPVVAGIIPYIKKNGNIYLLLGLESKNKKWSGFVGHQEFSDDSIIDSAIREFNEETATMFKSILTNIKLSMNPTNLFYLPKNNNRIFLWFVEFPKEYMEYDYKTAFISNRNILKENIYKEKIDIEWILLEDILFKKIPNVLNIFRIFLNKHIDKILLL